MADTTGWAHTSRAPGHAEDCSCQKCTDRHKQEAKVACIKELQVLAGMGNADPDSTGSLAIRAVEKYMNAIGQTEVMAAYNSVARY